MGAAIVRKLYVKSSNQTQSNQQANVPAQIGVPPPPTRTDLAQRTDLTPDEKQVLNISSAYSTPQQRADNYKLAQKLAVKTDTLNIKDCHSNPVVLWVMAKQEFTVVNPDNVAHTIIFNPQFTYTIPANGKSVITPQFEVSPGLYGYGCDKLPGPSGMIIVVAPQ
jgi:hypothetical protein